MYYINLLYIINVLYINVLSVNDVSWLVKPKIVVCELMTRLTLAHPPPSFPTKDKETDEKLFVHSETQTTKRL